MESASYGGSYHFNAFCVETTRRIKIYIETNPPSQIKFHVVYRRFHVDICYHYPCGSKSWNIRENWGHRENGNIYQHEIFCKRREIEFE